MFQGTSRLLIVLSCLTVLCLFLKVDSDQVAAASFEDGEYNGKPYKLYVPSDYDEDAEIPLVVMLHGCTQNAADFAAGTEMNAVAEQEGFMVLYPEQPRSGNFNYCWNWFEPAHQARESGEPATIAGMVGKVKDDYVIDDDRVYVTGLSAGGAMSVIMGATYPDVFTAIGVGSGLEYKAATNLIEANMAMQNGGPNPAIQGERAFEAMGEHARIVPVIVFHGSDDWTVRPINGDQVTEQWIETNNLIYSDSDHISKSPSETIQHDNPNGKNYTQYLYKNSKGESIVEKYIVHGMGHAWSGGSLQGSHTDPQGPSASEIMWNFFKSKSKEIIPDDDAPSTVATPPGGKYTTSVTVELNADREGTTYYTIDGSEPTTNSTVYSAPIVIEESTELKFFTIDVNDKKENVKTESYVINKDDDPENDLERLEIQQNESGYVGRLIADGLSNKEFRVGDKGMYNTDTYRAILSFDTSVLDNQTINSAKLILFTKSSTGTINNISVDVKNGYFGSSPTLERNDFLASATTNSITTIENVPATNGERIEIEIPLENLNRDGLTQFRLKAQTTAGLNRNLLELYKEDDPEYTPHLEIDVSN